MTPRPLGYASIEEFEQHLDVTLTDRDKPTAELYLRMAEAVVDHYTGGREFLPLNPTLAEALTDDGTAIVLTSVGVRLPDGGRVVIGSEVLSYGGRTITPNRVTLNVTARGFGATTAAAHDAGASVTVVRGFQGRGTSLYPGDFLELRGVWSGADSAWMVHDTTYAVPQPYNHLPYQWIEWGGGFSPGAVYNVAAVWGYSYDVPFGIKLATMRIAEEVFRRRGSNWTIVSHSSVEALSHTFRSPTVLPQDVGQILQTYIRRTI